tara:strand:+ start:7383 stop:7598 length:216 start_codon:yes stop_codon:yes gene_type:complete
MHLLNLENYEIGFLSKSFGCRRVCKICVSLVNGHTEKVKLIDLPRDFITQMLLGSNFNLSCSAIVKNSGTY